LYNPDRVTGRWSGTPRRIRCGLLDDALSRLQAKVTAARGHGIVFLTGADTSSFGDLVDEWMRQAADAG